MTPKVLFVFTSVSETLKGNATGWYLPEAAHPYYSLENKADIDFAAPEGPNPPVDPSSSFKDDVKFLIDPVVIKKFKETRRLSDVNSDDYDAIFYVGGHGPVIDLSKDPNNIRLANAFYRNDKIVSAVCHGPAALVGVTGADGVSIFQGKQATGFSNAEEKLAGKEEDVPFLLESRIKDLGGNYEKASEAWVDNVVVSGKLITGQNPASAKPLGEALAKALGVN